MQINTMLLWEKRWEIEEQMRREKRFQGFENPRFVGDELSKTAEPNSHSENQYSPRSEQPSLSKCCNTN